MGTIIPNMGIRTSSRKSSPKPKPPSLADALFTRVQQRVLGVLFGKPGRSFYVNEIIGMAQSGTGAVLRELARLEAAGIVNVTRQGNQKHCQANPRSPLFEEILGLAQKTFGLADIVRGGLEPVDTDIRAAFVYGSIAKGGDTSESDIDVLIISDRLAYADLFAALDVASARLGRKVAPTLYSRAEFRDRVKKGNAFLSRVLSQPKLWLIGSEDDVSKALSGEPTDKG